jgi:low molecular weight protein-tyrosine phosphatase
MVRILFVCLGNICRSPTAHGVFEAMLEVEGLSSSVSVDSAGTGAWHAGHSPDGRAQEVAKSRGFDLSHVRARQVEVEDFECFDYILAMDKTNLNDLLAQSPEAYKEKIKLFLSFGQNDKILEVPDPYYGGVKGFDTVLDLVENACLGLLDEIKKKNISN